MRDSTIKEKIEDLLELEEVDLNVEDTDDPDVIVITIKGRLRKDFNSKNHSDYDRAMKGITPYAEQVEDEG